MPKARRYSGFSLIEVLMAVGTLAIGMIFIGGTFLVAIHFTGVTAERTTAVIVANEAFAKIQIFDVNMADPNLGIDRQSVFPDQVKPLLTLRSMIDPDEFAYPSTRTSTAKQYFWSALCRLDPNDPYNGLLVTVFVSRKVGAATLYESPVGPIDRPVAMAAGVSKVSVDPDPAVLAIDAGMERWIGPGYTIVEDSTGAIYRVVSKGVGADEINLDPAKPWPWVGPRVVWVVPPPIGRGKGPCIGVYQTEIRF